MKKQNITSVNMDEILGGGSMKDIINRSYDDLFSSPEEKRENRTHGEENTKEEYMTSEKETEVEKGSKTGNNNKRKTKSEASCYSFICENSIKETIQAISRREGWTVRHIMEYALNQFIEGYNKAKPGLKIPKNTSSIENVMQQKKP